MSSAAAASAAARASVVTGVKADSAFACNVCAQCVLDLMSVSTVLVI